MRGVGGGGVTRRSHIVGESSSCEAQRKMKGFLTGVYLGGKESPACHKPEIAKDGGSRGGSESRSSEVFPCKCER